MLPAQPSAAETPSWPVSCCDKITYKEVVIGGTYGSQDVDLFSLVLNQIVDSALG